MDTNKRQVAIGLLGSKLDQAPRRGNRWERWRPSIAICNQHDAPIDRLELLYDARHSNLKDQIAKDVQSGGKTEVQTHEIPFDDPWDFEEVFASLHEFTRGYSFDTDQEDYLVHITTGTHVAQICLFLLAESRHFPAKLLQSSPPTGDESVHGSCRTIDLDLSRYDGLASRFQTERTEGHAFLKSGIETRNPQFNRLIERIERVSLATKAPILLTGPTGAGKTQLASKIYELKRIRQQIAGPLVEVNCATLRGDGAMATLFGHVKGAFTGAQSSRAGLLRTADKGILFLDEIGELGLDEQAMLLRAIESKSFLPVGSDQMVASDFQLLAGTNCDLTTAVGRGTFREDLLARINLWTFQLPGLADRRDDIDPNIDFELQRFSQESGGNVTMNRESRARFLAFALSPQAAWSAGFRDLNAAITRMATLCQSGRIGVDIVDEEIQRLVALWRTETDSGSDIEALLSVMPSSSVGEIDRFDQVQLAEVIRVCRRTRSLSEAGRALFGVSRKAKEKPNDADRLRKYLAKFELSWKQINDSVLPGTSH